MNSAIDEYNPTEDHLLCEQVEEADKIGTIIIPDSVRVPLTQGIVLKAGTSCDQELYQKGRVVIFKLHTEDRVTIGSTKYIIVNPVNVLITGPVVPSKP